MQRSISHKPIKVTCYSGHTYAERPSSFKWEGDVHRVKEVEKEWFEPGERHFIVLTEEGKTLELCYFEGEDRWSLIEIEVRQSPSTTPS